VSGKGFTCCYPQPLKRHQSHDESMSDVEKLDDGNIRTPDHLGLKDSYFLDASKVDTSEGLKFSRDHHNVLIPQPSEDPHDPLNWSQGRKNLILFVISATSLLADYGSATGAVTLIPQAQYVLGFNLNQSQHCC